MYINNEFSDASRSCLDTCPSDSAAPGKTPLSRDRTSDVSRGRAESTCFRMIKWAKQGPREAQSASPRPRKTSSTGVSASEEHKEERRRVLESPAGKPNFFTSHTHGDHQTILMGLNVDVSRLRSDPTHVHVIDDGRRTPDRVQALACVMWGRRDRQTDSTLSGVVRRARTRVHFRFSISISFGIV